VLDLAYTFKDAPAVGLEFGLTRATGPDTGTEAAELNATTAQSGKTVSQLRKFHLEHSLFRMGMLGEYVEDQCYPVHDVALEGLLKVSLLGRGEVIVEDDNVDVLGV
jgi:hypothetical protein